MGPDGTTKGKFFLDEVNTEKLFDTLQKQIMLAEGYRIANNLTTAADLKKIKIYTNKCK